MCETSSGAVCNTASGTSDDGGTGRRKKKLLERMEGNDEKAERQNGVAGMEGERGGIRFISASTIARACWTGKSSANYYIVHRSSISLRSYVYVCVCVCV